MKKKWSSGVDTGSSSVDTSPSSQRIQLTEVADHPFKRKDVGIKENLWIEACSAEIGSRSN
ncbi:hypothetical protein Taro_050262 [Colocasia esculenta]|uniref:Uncharacterized protein n=1 Tax=Colocasia esculenta TaxID=4460 RepID=A0A843XCZ1_COLES|nr:hypothetical protein [Colocasia esculenta]